MTEKCYCDGCKNGRKAITILINIRAKKSTTKRSKVLLERAIKLIRKNVVDGREFWD